MKIVFHPKYVEHEQWSGHPECPERLTGIVDKLTELSLFNNVIEPDPLDLAILQQTHDPGYIDYIKNHDGPMDADTYVHPETYDIALLAAGGVLKAAQLAHGGDRTIAFPRPPGHHAGADYGCGFCYFNNVAIVADYYARKGERIAIVDIDVHHGNGTSDIFTERKDVLYMSTHQWGIFPGTGKFNDVGVGDGAGYTINVPFNRGAGDSSFLLAYSEIMQPILSQFKPDMMLISVGGDTHYMDPLGELTLSSKGYRELAGSLIELAGELCSGRIAFALEGGYNIDAQAEAMAAIVAYPGEIPLQFFEELDDNELGRGIVDGTLDVQSGFWKV
jgi:acetoin utilization deacetylase AcuC-like enzyme